MSETTNNTNNTHIKLNSVSGTLFKTHDKSFFKRFHLQSNFAIEHLSSDVGTYIILQIMICGDMEVLAELVRRSDYENGVAG
ncbi:hypothetical protein HN39_01960 [Listeria monocytogenes]|nr:hypothetical protein JL53_00700 [Listeria ivanovii subsp. londoniensis]EAC4628475.1 hypothetical protein [Listeria monocytogenes]EAC6356328.1 hypothetical protein [Listeria monocytogenes]EAC7062857.1 hypothetical protein [Listeria monocytogenes]EAC7899137.1 hypothetical protein [Listeria monocytogenes]